MNLESLRPNFFPLSLKFSIFTCITFLSLEQYYKQKVTICYIFSIRYRNLWYL